jgi:predicted amidohydrolase
MRWDTIAAIMKAGVFPDTFSTDWNTNSRTTGVVDLPNCMSKLLGYGMSVSEAVACATVNAAHVPGLLRPRHAQRGSAGGLAGKRIART